MKLEPDVNSDDFISFLYWLEEDQLYRAKDIIYVVEKPWKYKFEYEKFLEKE